MANSPAGSVIRRVRDCNSGRCPLAYWREKAARACAGNPIVVSVFFPGTPIILQFHTRCERLYAGTGVSLHPVRHATKGNTESNSAKCEPNDVTTSKQASPGTGSNTRLAERQGFEPWDAHTSTVFKTAAIDHSATSPFRREAMCIPRLPGLQASCIEHRDPDRKDNSVSRTHSAHPGVICQLTSRAHGIKLGHKQIGGPVSYP